VKKLISIGVALGLLTMAVMPVAAAAYTEPPTYAKTPFAIIQAGMELIEGILVDAGAALGLPEWIAPIVGDVGGFAGEPLAWSVDMVGWGISLVGDVLGASQGLIEGLGVELPIDLGEVGALFDTIACGLFTPWSDVVAPPLDPCP
jgi:hypothetical protein